jgi:hypothetical protein
MCRRLYGEDTDHPHIAESLDNLASDLRALGEDQRADELAAAAAAMRRRLAAPDKLAGQP